MCAMLSVPQFLHHDHETNSLFQNTKYETQGSKLRTTELAVLGYEGYKLKSSYTGMYYSLHVLHALNVGCFPSKTVFISFKIKEHQ